MHQFTHRTVGVVLLTAALAAGCASSSESEGAPIGALESASTTQLTVAQVINLGALPPSTSQTVHYTGQRRYVGAKVHAKAGTMIVASVLTDSEDQPVAAVADDTLKVLDRQVGATLTGSPNQTFVDASARAPHDGDYWVLFSEASRSPATMHASYVILESRGAKCNAGATCLSNRCAASSCEASKEAERCLEDTDCASSLHCAGRDGCR